MKYILVVFAIVNYVSSIYLEYVVKDTANSAYYLGQAAMLLALFLLLSKEDKA